MRRALVLAAAAVAAAVALVPVAAHAEPSDVPELIKLIENQPSDMDKSAWREKRRDAARKLAASKDKRAVPVMIKLAESELYDIIGEIAIEGLGNLGDASAVPVLQKIANDSAREKPQRDLAKKALAKLGSSTAEPPKTVPPPPLPPPPPKGGTGEVKPGGGNTGLETRGGKLAGGASPPGGPLLGEKPPPAEPPPLPELPDDTLAAYDRLTFVGGTADAEYDTVRKRGSFNGDIGGTWERRIEREAMAWGTFVDAHVLAGLVNPDGRAQAREVQIKGAGGGEARFYSNQIYGVGKLVAGTQMNYIGFIDDDDPATDVKDARLTIDLQGALGVGFGRVLDVGAAIRVRRLSRALDDARALGKPIDAATARKLALTWWSLRAERSTYPTLVATVAILREAGILLGEPDAGLTYEILNVLRDGWLFARPSGLDLQVAIGEGYLRRPEDDVSGESGRVEQLLLAASYGQQVADDTLEISGGAYGRYRLFAPDTQPAPWAFGVTARMRRFTYGEHGDPYGVFDLSGEVRLSDDATLGDMDVEIGLRIKGQLGFTWWLNPASGLRLAASVAEDGGKLFFGAQLQITYGLLDGTFAGL